MSELSFYAKLKHKSAHFISVNIEENMRRNLVYNYTGTNKYWPAVIPNDGDIEIHDVFYFGGKCCVLIA